MKKGTKITVFILATALTAGTLFATLGPRHCHKGGCYSQCDANNNCTDTKNNASYLVPEGK